MATQTTSEARSQGEEVAWSPEALQGDPHALADKPQRVRAMFAAIARCYDLNNRLHSFGRDRVWRREAVREAAVRPGETVLDVACGTGDLTRLFARTHAKRVVGLDFTPEMLQIAEERRAREAKRGSLAAARVEYVQGDAMDLPFEDESFNVVSIAFGLRNVADPAQALAEFRRVLKPRGRLVVLEFSEPRSRLLRSLHRLYTHRIMPVTATWISKDRTGAYRYLPRSVEAFLDRRKVVETLQEAGFTAVTQRPLTFGVCVCYRGVAPAKPTAAPRRPRRR